MTHSLPRSFSIGLVAVLALPGCEKTGRLVEEDSGPSSVDAGSADANVDAGPPRTPQLEYTPDGCDYVVRTPEVLDARMGGDGFGSEAAPFGVHVSFAGAADSTFAVNWQTDLDTYASWVVYGTDEAAVRAADGDGDGVALQNGHTMLFGRAPNGIRIHEAHVCGLEAGTRYYYKVGGPGHWSPVYDVATSPTIGTTEPWSFAVDGDSRGNEDNAWAITQRRVREAGVDLQLFSGDAVLLGSLQQQWDDDFFGPADGASTVTDTLARIPTLLANGNHDQLALNYLAQFAFPQDVSDGEGAQGEEWFSFDYANAHFVFLNDTVLNDAVLSGAEASWLAADLAAADANRTNVPWIFVVHHKPLYTCLSTHSPQVDLRSYWQPLFDQYHVDVVWAGHNHVYERSRPIRGLDGTEGRIAAIGGSNFEPQIVDGVASGTVYVVAAGVGAPLYAVSTSCATSGTGMAVRNFVQVRIEGRTLHADVLDAMSGSIIDSFEWTK